MLLNDPVHAKGVLVWKLRQRIGMAVHRANAEMLLARIPHVGQRAASNAAREKRSQHHFFGSAGPRSASYLHTRSRHSWFYR